MKLRYFGTLALCTLLLFSSSLTSCKEDWDGHYSEVSIENKSDLNLYEYIKSQNNLSKFAKMLEVTGYDSLLSKSQVFTVWAPNDAALAGVDENNATLALQIVKNYVARFSYSTSGVSISVIPMINNKLIVFEKSADGYLFNGEKISEPNLAVSNGILHIMGEYVPYKMNVWEMIYNTNGLDSLKTYVNSLTKIVLDTAASYKDNVFVDSVFKTINPILNQLGALNSEDSIYTALLPNNTAWGELYNTISPYYKTLAIDGGDKVQRTNTLWTIAKNLFYRGRIDMPTSEKKLVSTGKYTTYEPNLLFAGARQSILSNGFGYIMEKNTLNDTASWNKAIVIEAESSNYGRVLSNYDAIVHSSVGAGYNISNKRYVSLQDASLSSIAKLHVTFPVPYTLSTKYNIYCVFVPRSILDINDMRPYQVKFYVNYVDETKQMVTKYVDADNKLSSSAAAQATFFSDPEKLDRLLIAKDLELPYSNVVFDSKTNEEFIKHINFSVKIENVTKKNKADTDKYSRDLLIDCIILEPVK